MGLLPTAPNPHFSVRLQQAGAKTVSGTFARQRVPLREEKEQQDEGSYDGFSK